MRDTPVIEVHIMPSDAGEPFGMGESPVPPIVPAIINAVCAATGKHVRQLAILAPGACQNAPNATLCDDA